MYNAGTRLTMLLALTGCPTAAPVPSGTRVVAVGDSLTIGAPGYIGGYRAPLSRMLPDLVFVGRSENVGAHEGHNGKRIVQISALVMPAIDELNPDVVLLMAGTNDLTTNTDIRAVLEDYVQFSEELRAHGPVVVVANVPFRAGERRDITAAYNAGLADAFVNASDGISIHDICGDLIFPEDFGDSTHPNAVGYAKMADRWSDAL